jgi:hypothetical protein
LLVNADDSFPLSCGLIFVEFYGLLVLVRLQFDRERHTRFPGLSELTRQKTIFLFCILIYRARGPCVCDERQHCSLCIWMRRMLKYCKMYYLPYYELPYEMMSDVDRRSNDYEESAMLLIGHNDGSMMFCKIVGIIFTSSSPVDHVRS